MQWMKTYGWMILLISLPGWVGFGSLWSLTSQYDSTDTPSVPRDAAVVLGAALWDGHPSPALRERLDMTLQLTRRHRVRYVVVSGGKGNRHNKTEAQAMKDYLVAKGMDPNRILLEPRASNTAENLAFSRSILKEKRLNRVYVVTHDFHMHRALRYARIQGIAAEPAPVHSKVLWTPFFKARETLAILKMWMWE